jgi:hypothetical protein
MKIENCDYCFLIESWKMKIENYDQGFTDCK